ncbi:MAG TPA: hypothetical protein VIK64_17185, partial [Anaerolineales bacterium]
MKKTPASLRSAPRPLCPGLPGRLALDWLADLNGIRIRAHSGKIPPDVTNGTREFEGRRKMKTSLLYLSAIGILSVTIAASIY